MSRFFATGTDSESESSSEDEPVVRAPAPVYTFSDDEEETKRVVRSMKEKRYEELEGIIHSIRNHRKIKDFSSALASFEELQKAYTRAAPVVQKEENGVAPRFFIRALVELDDWVVGAWNEREARKALSKGNSKALTSLRQKLRKYTKDFEAEISKFREDPDLPDDNERKDSSSSDESEDEEKPIKEKPKPEPLLRPPPEDDESSDSMDWASSSSDSSFSSDDEERGTSNIREQFIKKVTKKEDDEEKIKLKLKKREERRERSGKINKRDVADDGGEWETVRKGAATSDKPKMFAKDSDIDAALVVKKLGEISAARGRKRTDRRAQLELLHELRTVALQHNLGDALQLKLRSAIVAALFDYNPKVSDAMKPEYWSKLVENIDHMVTLLLAHEDMVLSETILEENEQLVTPPYQVRGCLLTYLERLDDEFTKLLKECDPHSNEYVERLKDEVRVSALIDRVCQVVERDGTPQEICRAYLRKIDHLYYKFDPRAVRKDLPPTEETTIKKMERYCKYIYAHDETDRLRTRAILSHIYHHALHDNWFQARDLLLMSHLQETVQHSDPSTQILYNRTMANLGLCAFRRGNVKEAHGCLAELMMTGKPKELLAQGLLPQRQHERSKEQEKIEKQRQMPFHMHINLELLECVYLVSAMLIEIPYMAAHEFDARRRMISKTFYQNLRASERQALVGPPESMREHAVAAARAMRRGDWRACLNYIVNEKMNAKVWDLMVGADNVRAMLGRLIREESLRTYLFTYAHVYASLSLRSLADMFELPRQRVHSLVSKMIINEELLASLDDPSECAILHRSEPTRMQALALQLADKVGNLVDSNERIFEKQGSFFQRGGAQRGEGRQRERPREGWNRRTRNRRRDDERADD
ncbi:eukaryotic translation initiation factor 3 subunit C isoform X1 [Bombyx mori]|uniref:Eukaryotic translation initiation factor 3 subunit C n=1 Tax=Bombyx mori TaxID=7091 RepID=A0A8R2G9M0_BOMMO|nr:eukaryotic translation initiation factor 3 subunit C isoform X1 [Bombyx mori]XP_012548086.1 eukaryotic translation initiation factor 3 subunit C isoform X1 [Bombyx mori]